MTVMCCDLLDSSEPDDANVPGGRSAGGAGFAAPAVGSASLLRHASSHLIGRLRYLGPEEVPR